MNEVFLCSDFGSYLIKFGTRTCGKLRVSGNLEQRKTKNGRDTSSQLQDKIYFQINSILHRIYRASGSFFVS